MKRGIRLSAFALGAGCLVAVSMAAETKPRSFPGLENVQLETAVSAVVPGESFTVGLLIDPQPGFHTYWRGPGLVGVATTIEWTLPEGFQAGEISWPAPEQVDMVGISANGYASEVMLLTEITAPETLEADSVELKAKIAWMACATQCNPGVADFILPLPVEKSADDIEIDQDKARRFEKTRESLPVATPSSWALDAHRVSPEVIRLRIAVPDHEFDDANSVHFFGYDHQVDSDRPQRARVDSGGNIVLELPRSEYSPRSPEALRGVVRRAAGWPGLSGEAIEISVPWQDTAESDE